MKKFIALICSILLSTVVLSSCGKDTYYVEISVRDYGKIILKLDANNAPRTVRNFVKLANNGFYDGLTFHRVQYNFMIQGGDPNANGTGSSKKKIVGEFASNGYENNISHKRGVISMARGDEPNSASCQFFICNADSTFLDGKYAAFGYVIEGMDVVDAITISTMFYADPQSGTIYNKELQAQIEYIKVLEDYQEQQN
jgi:peptidyl-prolyl cis-trans isomerase B (cyclophilin B)